MIFAACFALLRWWWLYSRSVSVEGCLQQTRWQMDQPDSVVIWKFILF